MFPKSHSAFWISQGHLKLSISNTNCLYNIKIVCKNIELLELQNLERMHFSNVLIIYLNIKNRDLAYLYYRSK